MVAPDMAAAEATVDSCVANSRQRCDALARLLVPRAMLAETEDVVLRKLEPLTGGPVLSQVQQDRVRQLIQAGVDEGNGLLTGGPDTVDVPDGLRGGFALRPRIGAVLRERRGEVGRSRSRGRRRPDGIAHPGTDRRRQVSSPPCRGGRRHAGDDHPARL